MTATTPLDIAHFAPAKLTPDERAVAVATILAAGLLRPEHVPPPVAAQKSQGILGEST